MVSGALALQQPGTRSGGEGMSGSCSPEPVLPVLYRHSLQQILLLCAGILVMVLFSLFVD